MPIYLLVTIKQRDGITKYSVITETTHGLGNHAMYFCMPKQTHLNTTRTEIVVHNFLKLFSSFLTEWMRDYIFWALMGIEKLYKTCMRSGFRSVYILLLACTTSTKQQPHENYFWILSITLDFFSTTAMMPSGKIRKIRSHPNFKKKFSFEYVTSWNIRYQIWNICSFILFSFTKKWYSFN